MKALMVSPFVGQRLRPLTTTVHDEGLDYLIELLEDGTVTPVIDRTYELNETPEAIRYLEANHARGKVIISLYRPRTSAVGCGGSAGRTIRWILQESLEPVLVRILQIQHSHPHITSINL